MTINILVSACLLGVNCRYDGGGKFIENLEPLIKSKAYQLIPVCPEQLGGLPTPRVPAERVEHQVITQLGEDVTVQFEKGSKEVLKLAQLYNCRLAFLKERSPSCGKGEIYDGTFSGILTVGDGVTAELLEASGIKVIGESQIKDFISTCHLE